MGYWKDDRSPRCQASAPRPGRTPPAPRARRASDAERAGATRSGASSWRRGEELGRATINGGRIGPAPGLNGLPPPRRRDLHRHRATCGTGRGRDMGCGTPCTMASRSSKGSSTSSIGGSNIGARPPCWAPGLPGHRGQLHIGMVGAITAACAAGEPLRSAARAEARPPGTRRAAKCARRRDCRTSLSRTSTSPGGSPPEATACNGRLRVARLARRLRVARLAASRDLLRRRPRSRIDAAR